MSVSITVTGKASGFSNWVDEKKFREILCLLLVEAALDGEFKVIVDKQITGKAHTKGFRLGVPDASRKAVKVFWQGGGNGTRFACLLLPRPGTDLHAFYSFLKRACATIKSRREKTRATRHIERTAVELTELHQEASQTEVQAISELEIELFMQEIVVEASDRGVVVRDDCLNALEELGRPASDLDELLRRGFLTSESQLGDAMFVIPAGRLVALRKELMNSQETSLPSSVTPVKIVGPPPMTPRKIFEDVLEVPPERVEVQSEPEPAVVSAPEAATASANQQESTEKVSLVGEPNLDEAVAYFKAIETRVTEAGKWRERLRDAKAQVPSLEQGVVGLKKKLAQITESMQEQIAELERQLAKAREDMKRARTFLEDPATRTSESIYKTFMEKK